MKMEALKGPMPVQQRYFWTWQCCVDALGAAIKIAAG